MRIAVVGEGKNPVPEGEWSVDDKKNVEQGVGGAEE